MPMPRTTQGTTFAPSNGGAKAMRRPVALVGFLVALLVGALALGSAGVQAQSVFYNFNTTSPVAPGGTLVITITSPGVTLTSATAPITGCPQTIATSATSVTYTCGVTTTGGLPQNTQLGLTFLGTTGTVTGTVTYNANGPFGGSTGVSTATPVTPINCPNLSSAGSETCTSTTTTQIVPGGDLVVTIQGGAGQLVSITSPGPIGSCQPISTASTSLAASTTVTYSCVSGQSIASGTSIAVNVSTNNPGQPTIALNQNANAPLAGAPVIPASISQPLNLGAVLATVTGINPSSGTTGTSIVITGTNLTGLTAVNFAGVPGTIQNCNVAGTICTVTPPFLPSGTAAQVTVTSAGGQSNSVTFTYGSATPPNVTFVNPPTIGSPGQSVTFNANATTSSSCGSISTYSYNFGDNTGAQSGSLSNQSHTYASAGTYTVTLTVTDCSGATGSTSSSIVIGQAVSGNSVSYPIGWNIVAGPPSMTVSGSTPPLYTYQINNTAYQVVNSQTGLQSGWGYWAYFPVATSVTVPTTSPLTVTVPLGAGQWTMIGNPGSGTATVSGVDVLYTYTAATGYVAATILNPGQGGWAFSNSGGSATINGQ